MTLSVGQILAVQVLGCSPMSQIAGDRLTVGLDGHIGQLVQLGDKRGAVSASHVTDAGTSRDRGEKR